MTSSRRSFASLACLSAAMTTRCHRHSQSRQRSRISVARPLTSTRRCLSRHHYRLIRQPATVRTGFPSQEDSFPAQEHQQRKAQLSPHLCLSTVDLSTGASSIITTLARRSPYHRMRCPSSEASPLQPGHRRCSYRISWAVPARHRCIT